MPSSRAETRFARRELGKPMYDTPLGERLISSAHSAIEVARAAGVRKSCVSDFLHGRITKVGRQNCRRIRAALIELGIIKPRLRKPPVCRTCGTIYPTRKRMPVEIRSTSNNQVAQSSVGTPSRSEETRP